MDYNLIKKIDSKLQNHINILSINTDNDFAVKILRDIISTLKILYAEVTPIKANGIDLVYDYILQNSPVKKSTLTIKFQNIGRAEVLGNILNDLCNNKKIILEKVGNKTLLHAILKHI